MSEQAKSVELSRSIIRQVYPLVMIAVLTVGLLLGIVHWNEARFDEIKDRSTAYHASTIRHLDSIEKEIFLVQKTTLAFHVARLGLRPSIHLHELDVSEAAHSDLIASVKHITAAFADVAKIQARFGGLDFHQTVARAAALAQRIQDDYTTNLRLILTDDEPYERVERDLRAFLVAVTQLKRLHGIFLNESEASLVAQGQQNRLTLAGLLVMALSLGAVIVVRLLQLIRRGLTEKGRAESALRGSEASLINAQRIANLGNWDWNIATGDLYWSDQIYRIFGLEPQQFDATYEAFLQSVHPDDRNLVQAAVDRALSEREPYSIDHRIVLPDGVERIVHEQGEVIFDEAGNPVRMTGTVQDITKQKQAQEALRESETSLANAQRMAHLGNYEWDLTTDELRWSDEAYRIFGVIKEGFEPSIETFKNFVHPDDRDTVRAAIENLIEHNRPFDIQFRIVRADGSERILRDHAEVTRDENGRPIRLLGAVFDITTQARAEEEILRLNEDLERQVEERTIELRESEKQLRLITDNVPAAIAYVDVDQRYQFINKRYEEWFGISAAEAYWKHVRDVMGETAYNAVKENLEKALSGKLVAFEARIPTKDAGPRDVEATYVPHHSDDGTVKGVFVLVTDITERKRLEADLLRQGRLATLGQLTATVSHELRNPLGVIRTSAYTLRAGLNLEEPRAARALERVERSVVRCDRIIDELLDFTRITELDPQPEVLDDWLAGVLDEQVLPAGLVLRRGFGLPNMNVSFDRDRFRRAVINVFDNACQAMLGESDSQARPEQQVLTVRTQARDGRVEVVFEDQGSGIPAEVYERIFEPLFSTKGFGVGLGLPVVKQIMAQHGGGIEIETEVGVGTTVRLWLEPQADVKGAAA